MRGSIARHDLGSFVATLAATGSHHLSNTILDDRVCAAVGDRESTRIGSGCSPSCRSLRGPKTIVLVTHNILYSISTYSTAQSESLRIRGLSEPYLSVVRHPHRALQAEC